MFDKLDCETIKVLIASFGICNLWWRQSAKTDSDPLRYFLVIEHVMWRSREERKLTFSCENISICRKMILVPPLDEYPSSEIGMYNGSGPGGRRKRTRWGLISVRFLNGRTLIGHSGSIGLVLVLRKGSERKLMFNHAESR